MVGWFFVADLLAAAELDSRQDDKTLVARLGGQQKPNGSSVSNRLKRHQFADFPLKRATAQARASPSFRSAAPSSELTFRGGLPTKNAHQFATESRIEVGLKRENCCKFPAHRANSTSRLALRSIAVQLASISWWSATTTIITRPPLVGASSAAQPEQTNRRAFHCVPPHWPASDGRQTESQSGLRRQETSVGASIGESAEN